MHRQGSTKLSSQTGLHVNHYVGFNGKVVQLHHRERRPMTKRAAKPVWAYATDSIALLNGKPLFAKFMYPNSYSSWGKCHGQVLKLAAWAGNSLWQKHDKMILKRGWNKQIRWCLHKHPGSGFWLAMELPSKYFFAQNYTVTTRCPSGITNLG